jgi:hypothetical protein
MPPKRNRRGAKDLVETAVESEFDASYAEDELTDIKSEGTLHTMIVLTWYLRVLFL